MDREHTGDGPTGAVALAHPLVQAAIELFDGEVVLIRPVSAPETCRAA